MRSERVITVSSIFQRERWSLHASFDPVERQSFEIAFPGDHPLGELTAFESRILETFGGLPEEYAEIVRSTGEGSIEVTSHIIDWLATLMEWIVGYTIPREVRLVRNDEREH